MDYLLSWSTGVAVIFVDTTVDAWVRGNYKLNCEMLLCKTWDFS